MTSGVHLVTAGFTPRDAISQHVVEEQRILRGMGLRCEILADPALTHASAEHLVHSVWNWQRIAQPGDVAVLHYSIANAGFEDVLAHADRCVLAYHNITPAELLWEFAPHLALECGQGRARLANFARRVVAAAADSEYNAAELRDLGFPEPSITGVLRAPLPAGEKLRQTADGPLRVLFVGRVVPNKAQHDLVLAIGALSQAGVDVDLSIVGAWEGLEEYRRYCEHLAAAAGVSDRVEFAGSISDSALADAYTNSDIFLCLSDHEGYCAPLVEAMEANLPIVAYASSAVPWTVGDAALLLDCKPPSLVAEAVLEVTSNAALRDRMSRARKDRLAFLGHQQVAARIAGYIGALL